MDAKVNARCCECGIKFRALASDAIVMPAIYGGVPEDYNGDMPCRVRLVGNELDDHACGGNEFEYEIANFREILLANVDSVIRVAQRRKTEAAQGQSKLF